MADERKPKPPPPNFRVLNTTCDTCANVRTLEDGWTACRVCSIHEHHYNGGQIAIIVTGTATTCDDWTEQKDPPRG